jgi:hypothetical protein
VGVKDDLHRAVDELSEERARRALAYLRALLEDGMPPGQQPAGDRLTQRMGSQTVPGRDFFAAPAVNLATLMVRQGVKPIANFDDLLGDFWPEDESADEFVAAVRRWRHEGGCA